MIQKLLKVTFFLVVAMPAIAQNSFTLKECIGYGLKNHGSMQIAKNNIDYAYQQGREALSGYLPQVNGSYSLDDKYKLPMIAIGDMKPMAMGKKYNNTMAVQVDQTIYDQTMLLGIKANEPNKQMAALDELQNEQDVVYNVASAYYKVIVAQKQLQLLEQNKTQFEQLLKVANLQSQQGVAKRVDVKKVQVNLNNVLSQISVAENAYELTLNALKNVMGMSQDNALVLTDTARWLTSEPQNQLEKFDYKKSVEYELQQKQLELLGIQQRITKAGALPRLSFYANYGGMGMGDNFGNSYNPLYGNGALGLKLSINLFDGLRRNAKYKEGEINILNTKVNLQLNEAARDLQFRNAATQITRTGATVVTNKENMQLASEVYDNVTLQYKQGVASLTDLLNAESSYRDAQNNYVQSLLSYYLAQLDIRKANSTILDYYNTHL